MFKKINKIIALITVFLIPLQFALSNELILPKKKPTLSEDIIKEKIIKGEIIPLKKPSEVKETVVIKNEEIQKSKITKVIDSNYYHIFL